MNAIIYNVKRVFQFDCFKLKARLEQMEDANTKTTMVLMTILSDTARLALIGFFAFWVMGA